MSAPLAWRLPDPPAPSVVGTHDVLAGMPFLRPIGTHLDKPCIMQDIAQCAEYSQAQGGRRRWVGGDTSRLRARAGLAHRLAAARKRTGLRLIGLHEQRGERRMTIKVVDFFSGCGGTSAGLRAAGMDIILGLDTDADAADTFAANFPEADFIRHDIRTLETEALAPYLLPHRGQPVLFSGCAPCQPFSQQNRRRKTVDERVALLLQFGRFVERYRPEFVFVENVPPFRREGAMADELPPFVAFLQLLRGRGYRVDHRVVDARDYGVPQWRKRLVLVASLGSLSPFPSPTHGPDMSVGGYATVWEWIGDLPPIAAGETHPSVPNHRAAGLSPLNLRRIGATPAGGGRLDWPAELRLPCHLKGYTGHTDVYGRMHKDQPARGLTTRCISLSNGRFGHPTQDRAISVREAACLQTFPRDFVFRGGLDSVARQIGNAVPPLLAERIGACFVADSGDDHPDGAC